MKNASKTVFGLLNLVKIREIGTTFSKKSQYLVYNPESVLGRPSILLEKLLYQFLGNKKF
jgi:hypothetical protein